MQEEKPGEEERAVAKSKPMVSLVPKTDNQSPTTVGSSVFNSLGTLKAHNSNSDRTGTVRPVAKGLNENTAPSSQVWHPDTNTNTSTERPVSETTKKTIGTQLSHHNF